MRKVLDAVTAAAGASDEAGRSLIGLANALELDVVWADTTGLKANIHYPIDWVLLRDATRTLMKSVVHVHYWSNLNIKDTLARLRRNQNPADGVTWEVPDDVPEDYLKQMESEHRVKDKGKWAWLQIGSRPNHYFDCELGLKSRSICRPPRSGCIHGRLL